MRRLLFLFLPILAVGCAPGRQAAISNSGRVASTDVRHRTDVADVGRIGPEAEDVAWSPDGSTLAYSARDATVLWPRGGTIPGMGGKLAWSPDGRSLAGVVANNVAVWDVATGNVRETQTLGIPTAIRWMLDGRVLEVDGSGFQVEGMRRVIREGGEVFDAVPQPDGKVVWLEGGDTPRFSARLNVPILRGRWDPADGTTSVVPIGRWGTILSAPMPYGLGIATRFALAPGGTRYAVAGLTVVTDPKSLSRLKALADMDRDPTPRERREYKRLSDAARKRNVLAIAEPGRPAHVLWTETLPTEEGAPTDLEWSPDGRWIAVARTQGTVRIKVGSP